MVYRLTWIVSSGEINGLLQTTKVAMQREQLYFGSRQRSGECMDATTSWKTC